MVWEGPMSYSKSLYKSDAISVCGCMEMYEYANENWNEMKVYG